VSDKWSGRTIATGYTALTEAEYKAVSEGSPTFRHYKDKLKLLVVCDELPAEAKTPHEALRDAGKDARKAAGDAAALKAENEKLKSDLFDAEKRYKELQSSSTAEETLKPLNDKIASLEKDKEAMKADIEKLTTDRDARTKERDAAVGDAAALRAENEKLTSGAGKAPAKGGVKGKDFE
jgi:chromosome segregation ATPase